MRDSFVPSFRFVVRVVSGLATIAWSAGCGGGVPGPGGASVAGSASDAEWTALARARPQPMDGAVRLSVGQVRIVGESAWPGSADVSPSLGLSELVAAGLLRRGDVHFVERRRFAAAADSERRGEFRGAGAPRVGVSPGAELVLAATWSSVGLDSAFLDVRLTDAQSGGVVGSWRGATASDADPTSVARSVVAGAVAALSELGRLPAWTDPLPEAAPSSYRATGIPAAALEAFFLGLAAEERWSWERARAGYQSASALAKGAFFEADVALARAARLRNGGTLGAS